MVPLALLTLALGQARPALAHECPEPEGTTIESLHHCVEHCREMGHIDNDGVARSLLGKIEAARDARDRGQLDLAVALLETFINEVEAQAGKHIDPEHAAHMVEHANRVIGALELAPV
jgi:hypothetical protein